MKARIQEQKCKRNAPSLSLVAAVGHSFLITIRRSKTGKLLAHKLYFEVNVLKLH